MLENVALNFDFKEMDEEDFAYLKSIIPGNRVFLKDDILEDYSKDELADTRRYPDVVIEVESAEEVSKIVKYAYEKTIPVVPRGMGTGLVGGSVAIHGGIMISSVRMNRILEIDEINMTATVEPGVIITDLAAACEEKGLLYAPEPGEKSAAIGGNISTNAGGMKAIKYGVTRECVLGLELVLPNGDIMETGGKVVKNTTGYSLKDIIIGSEGTLAFITKAIVKLVPLPTMNVTLLVPFETLSDAMDAVPLIICSKTVPTAVEFMEGKVIHAAEAYEDKKFPDNSSDAYLLLRFDANSEDEIALITEDVANICLEAGAIDVILADTKDRSDEIWKTRGLFLEAIKGSTTEMDECDVVVPRSEIAEFILYTREVEKNRNVRLNSFGHAGDGNLHVYILRDQLNDEDWEQMKLDVFDDLYKKAKELRGSVSGEHGIGYAKIPYLEEQIGDEGMVLFRRIKYAFDPKNIMNPGKICN